MKSPIFATIFLFAIGGALGIFIPKELRGTKPTRSFGPPLRGGSKVIGGDESVRHSRPYTVSLQIPIEAEWTHICGGVIYDDLHVITAAPCATLFDIFNFRVVAAEHDIFTEEGNEQFRSVESAVVHAQYDEDTIENDVAILTLSTPLIFNSMVQPIRIAPEGLEPSGECLNIGWGYQDVVDPNLQEVALDIIPRSRCQENYSGINPVTNGMICGGKPSGGVGGCQGDSGSPLICKEENGREYLAGIVSWTVLPCGQPDYPTVFTNIAFYRQWFSDNMN